MNLIIKSPANPRIKELVKLRDSPRRRKERGVFFVEGGDDLLALIRAGKRVDEIYGCLPLIKSSGRESLIDELKKLGHSIIETSSDAQKKASYRTVGNDFIGVVKAWDLSIRTNLLQGDGPVIILDELEKPGNLGAILRSVEAFGGAGVVLSDPALDFFNANVVRSSRGLLGSVPVAVGTKQEVLNWLKLSKREIFATSSNADLDLGKVQLTQPIAFIFGSEKIGLGEFWKNAVTKWIRIPMKGSASSLNLNVSVGCVLYECIRSF